MTRKPNSSLTALVARTRYEHLRSLRTQLNHCRFADPERPEDIKELLAILARAGLLQKEIARRLKTGQTTVSRWAAGAQLPQSPYQRVLLVEALRNILADHVKTLAGTSDPVRPGSRRIRAIKPSGDPQ